MRILITNLYVANYSGSEIVVEMLADGLRRAGHNPMVLAAGLGPQSDRMRTRGHIVVDRVSALPDRPDLIHAQHTTAAISALAAFPDVPAVYACHSALFEVEAPRPHPQIRRWIAVDDLCRTRCLARGVPEDKLTLILNAVDLGRHFRRPPLPDRPRRALLLSKNIGHQAAIRAACAEHSIALDEMGSAYGRISDQLEHELPAYDIVFATARMALEAAATGCAVIVCDGRGFAGALTSERLAKWRRLNFGAGVLAHRTTADAVSDALADYDAADAALVTDRLREEASLGAWVDQHLTVYEAALSDPAPAASACQAATAQWIEDLVPSAADRGWSVIAREIFSVTAEPTTTALRDALADVEDRLRQQIADNSNRLEAKQELRDALASVEGRLQRQIADICERLEAKLDEISRASQKPTLLESFKGLWRRVVPHKVRAGIHGLRRRVLNAAAGRRA